MITLDDIHSAAILIVDDQSVNVQLLEYLLTNTGYTCFPDIRNFTSLPAPSTAPLTARFTESSLLPWIPGETAAIACLFGDVGTTIDAIDSSVEATAVEAEAH